MNFLSGFELIRRDPDAPKKIGLCGVLMLSSMCIPFAGTFVLTGYMSALMQRAVRGQDNLLPRLDFDFDYLMKLAVSGFRTFVVQIAWGLILFPVILVGYGCIGGGALLGAQLDSGLVSGLCAAVGGLLMIGCIIPFILVLMCAVTRAQLADDIGTGFQFSAALSMAKAMWKDLLLGGIVLSMVFFGLYLVGVIACFIGMFFTLPVGMIISAHYSANVYREYVARGGEAVNVAHLPDADPPGSSSEMRPQAF